MAKFGAFVFHTIVLTLCLLSGSSSAAGLLSEWENEQPLMLYEDDIMVNEPRFLFNQTLGEIFNFSNVVAVAGTKSKIYKFKHSAPVVMLIRRSSDVMGKLLHFYVSYHNITQFLSPYFGVLTSFMTLNTWYKTWDYSLIWLA